MDWSGIKKFEILDWINEIQTNDQDLSYNIHQWKMKQFPRFYETDRQIQIFRVFVLIIHDKYKWSTKVILFKTGILVDFWMNFVDILWFLCGHFAWFWLGTCLRASFPIICPWKSFKIQQKLGVKSRHPVEDKQIILWKSELKLNIFSSFDKFLWGQMACRKVTERNLCQWLN